MASAVKRRRTPQVARDAVGAVSATNGWVALFLLMLAATAIVVGLIWDISWDFSFGRDSFWSPPHVAVNSGGLLAWVVAVWMAVSTTRRGDPASVGFGSVRIPLGAGFVLWGGCAVLASGVLDRWWSRAYGMTFGTWSPPQILFTAGVAAILVGVLLFAASMSNLAVSPQAEQSLVRNLPALCAAGLLLTFATIATGQHDLPNLQHGAFFYMLSCSIYPLLLLWTGHTRATPWGATVSALIYALIVCLMIWLLPLIAAQPLIGPVYQKIDHMVPPRFPLLLFIPALATDSLMSRASARSVGSAWVLAAVLGALFFATFLVVQWNFSAFLLSPASDNWFWAGGGRHWPLYVDIGPERLQFWDQELSPLTTGTVTICVGMAILAARIGLWLGSWMENLRR